MAPLIRRSRFARIHRWLGVALSPVIVLMLLSGIVLAARPWMDSRHPVVQRPIDVERLIANVSRLDSAHVADLLVVMPRRTQFVLVSRRGGARGPFDIVTGAPVPEASAPAPELLDRAGAVHDDLGIGAGWLVSLGSVALVLIAGIGPFLSRNAGRGTILGRHVRTGWLLMPLALWLPATLVMIRLELPKRSPPDATTMSMEASLRRASVAMDLRGVGVVQAMPGWTFLVASVDGRKPERFLMHEGVVTPLKGRLARLGYTLHEGSWGGPLGGIVNVVAALVMLWMLGTGLVSSWRRRAVSPRRAARSAHAV